MKEGLPRGSPGSPSIVEPRSGFAAGRTIGQLSRTPPEATIQVTEAADRGV
jgi:hypothetical protein